MPNAVHENNIRFVRPPQDQQDQPLDNGTRSRALKFAKNLTNQANYLTAVTTASISIIRSHKRRNETASDTMKTSALTQKPMFGNTVPAVVFETLPPTH